MNIIELLVKEKDVLSIGGIENRVGIPHGVLVKSLNGSRSLPDKYIPLLEKFWDEHTRHSLDKTDVAKPVQEKPVTTNKKVDNPVVKEIKEAVSLPDLNGDGSFNMDKWEKLGVKMCHKTRDDMVGFTGTNPYFPR